VRWVATREGESDLLVQCGVVVDFKKSTFLKSKIQAGTLEETKPVHRNLFRTAKAAILAARGEEVPEVAEEEVAEEMTVANARRFDNYILAAGGALVLLVFLWRIMARGQSQVPYFSEDIALLGQRMDKMEADIQMVQETLDEILALLKNRNAQ
jgi:shikimate kinase